MKHSTLTALFLSLSACTNAPSRSTVTADETLHLQSLPNAFGAAETLSSAAAGDHSNPFFADLGTNGRTCATCHEPADGWTIVPAHIQERFDATDGLDPLFRAHDGANAPTADVSTVEARRQAYSMLLERGDIRLGLPVPAGAEFKIVSVDDPWGYARPDRLSIFRRPLPTTNFRFLSAVGWDGGASTGRTIPEAIALVADLANMNHAQGTAIEAGARAQLVALISGQVTAQSEDKDAGSLTDGGALGGPQTLATQEFYIGINDPIGMNPQGKAFDPAAIKLFDAWKSEPADSAKAKIARGQALFNGKTLQLAGVKGLNDKVGQAVIQGTCSTCHDSPNVGDHSVAMALDIGIADASRRFAGLPLYTLQNLATGETLQTTDPGRALTTGKWADIGKFKGPILRSVANRAPYFHNGFAQTLEDVVNFYDQRFQAGMTEAEKSDLVAFLKAL